MLCLQMKCAAKMWMIHDLPCSRRNLDSENPHWSALIWIMCQISLCNIQQYTYNTCLQINKLHNTIHTEWWHDINLHVKQSIPKTILSMTSIIWLSLSSRFILFFVVSVWQMAYKYTIKTHSMQINLWN